MAQIILEEDEISLQLSKLEVIGAFHRSPRSSMSNLLDIRRVENPWSSSVMRGMRAPGTGIPFLIMLGTLRYRGGKDFAAIYGRNPAYVLRFKGEEFNSWLISDSSKLPAALSAKVII